MNLIISACILCPSCRREFVGSSGCCSSGEAVWDVCDCTQEGQLEVSFVFALLQFFSFAFYGFSSFMLFSIVPIQLCICFFGGFFVVISVFFPGSSFTDLFVLLQGDAFPVWQGFRTHTRWWIIVIYRLSLLTSFGWFIQLRSVITTD